MTALADAAVPYQASGFALTCGLIMTAASWLVALASWFNWKNYSAAGHEDRVVVAIALMFTFATAFMGTTWIEAAASPAAGLVDVAQKALTALTLTSGASIATIYWFNRPRFLVPRRYRHDHGRWADRSTARRGR